MDPATTALVLTILAKYGPELAQGVITVLHIEKATPADWETHVFSKARKSYDSYIAGTGATAVLVQPATN